MSKFPRCTSEHRLCKVHNLTNFFLCCGFVSSTNIFEPSIVIMERKSYPSNENMISELEFDSYNVYLQLNSIRYYALVLILYLRKAFWSTRFGVLSIIAIFVSSRVKGVIVDIFYARVLNDFSCFQLCYLINTSFMIFAMHRNL